MINKILKIGPTVFLLLFIILILLRITNNNLFFTINTNDLILFCTVFLYSQLDKSHE